MVLAYEFYNTANRSNPDIFCEKEYRVNIKMLIEEYRPEWVLDFDRIKKIINSELSALNITIEHVGSTAVEHLPSKPIIDIDIVYYNHDHLDTIKNGLNNLGYYHNDNQGIEGREVFKRNNQSDHQLLDTVRHHLYVCHHENEELKRHILFRDHLRANKDSREAYARIKYDIAEQANQDKKVYASLKEAKARAFINECIMKQAMEVDNQLPK